MKRKLIDIAIVCTVLLAMTGSALAQTRPSAPDSCVTSLLLAGAAVGLGLARKFIRWSHCSKPQINSLGDGGQICCPSLGASFVAPFLRWVINPCWSGLPGVAWIVEFILACAKSVNPADALDSWSLHIWLYGKELRRN
jgi:hypothetical protein